MSKFIEGSLVRCVNDRFHDESTNPFKACDLNLPIEGENYTVRDVVDTPYGIGLRLTEIHNKSYYFDNIGEWKEPIFSTSKFEIIERKTS